MHKLVSIITPCYNGEKYLKRYFESILAQTYPAVELFFVNDGSNDGTERIALEYGEKLRAKGYRFEYIYQENAGQSAAINQGLVRFNGEYLNWTDSDDYIPADSIEKRVSFLESHPEAGLVIGRSIIVDSIDYKQIGIIDDSGLERTQPHQLVEDFLQSKISCACCSAMVRSSMFRDVMPDPPLIETPREIGQNYQLFLPIMFSFPTFYVADVFSYYVVHVDSHSHSQKTFEQKLHIQDVAAETLNSIADRLKVDDNERNWFKDKIAEYDCKNRLVILQHHQKKDGLNEIISRMKRLGCFDIPARKLVLKIKHPLIKRFADNLWKMNNQ